MSEPNPDSPMVQIAAALEKQTEILSELNDNLKAISMDIRDIRDGIKDMQSQSGGGLA